MRRKLVFATATFLLLAHIFGCTSDELTGTRQPNRPPEVRLSIGPPEGSVTSYKVHLFWTGWDPDGEIAYFEYAITNNRTGVFDPADTTGADKWHHTTQTDSTFLFTADVIADSSQIGGGNLDTYEYFRPHTFFVRAVDDRGLVSKNVAYRSFTARTLSPEVDVLTPIGTGFSPALMPPVITFQWIARDYINSKDEVQEPDSVRWILVNTLQFGGSWDATSEYVRTTPDSPDWSRWRHYGAPGDSGKFWTNDPALPFGNYVFAVQAKDDAGAVTPVFDLDRNMRRVSVTPIATGPIVSLAYQYMNTIVTSSADTPPAIVNLPGGLPIAFSWTADASDYGGTVHGYRYGWDILDLNDRTQWETDITPFVGPRAYSPRRTFFFGTHTFFLEIVDNSGLITRASVVVNIIPFTMERSVLVIDDWQENSWGFKRTLGALPSDAEHDNFWAQVLSDVDDFVADADIWNLEGGVRTVPIQLIAKYKAVIWNTRGTYNSRPAAELANHIKFMHPNPGLIDPDEKLTPNLVRAFMSVGGRVLICGEHAMTTAINRDLIRRLTGRTPLLVYPYIFRYELTGDQVGFYRDSEVGVSGIGDGSFAYDEACLNVLDIAFIQNPGGVRGPGVCPVGLIRDRSQLDDGLRACNPVDETHEFPRLTLRPEVSGPGKWFHESVQGLNCDIYNPPYFGEMCNHIAELIPRRSCFQPIYTLECRNTSSAIFGAPVAFWTASYADRVTEGGVPARSAVWGFDPVYFNPYQVKQALNIILFDEWQIHRN